MLRCPGSLHMASQRIAHNHSLNLLFVAAGALLIALASACATTPPVVDHPNQRAMEGRTKEQILACAGQPERERSHEELTLMRYYKEAPLLQESMVGSKGSRGGAHHGCWATVVLKDGKVLEVRYHSVPAGVDATDHCEEIFESCVQPPAAP